MRVSNVVAVDSEKFKKILKQRGLSCMSLAKDMGRSGKYVSNKVYKEKGQFTGADVTFLEKVYGIKYEDYKWEEPATPEAKAEAPKPEAKAVMIQPVRVTGEVPIKVNAEEFYQLIYKATYEAMKMALKG